jgi:cellulose synthase/poly-beta-1,6-N-acetylglucosamine synthase-like glycosyltransferase
MWIEIAALALLAMTLPGTIYLAVLTLAAHRRPPIKTPKPQAPALKVALVVPAHNEGLHLLRTLRSLQAACHGDALTQIWVVADNCTDNTADVARSAGVQVLERFNDAERGKGYALEHAFKHIPGVDWFVVVDADTDVELQFVDALRAQMSPDTAALQCRYLVRDALASRRGTLSEVAWAAWNVLRPRGRGALGLSVGILGNGFALSRQTLEQVPYTARSIVEDVEYHILLVQLGLRVRWVDTTTVRGDMPTADAAAGTQRARWEGGRLRLALDRVPGLLWQGMTRNARLLDPTLDLLLLPLAMHVGLLLLALGLGLVGSGTAALWALGCLAVVVWHVFTGLRLIDAQHAHWSALLQVPGYIVWKLLLTAKVVKAAGRKTEWVRSEREPGPGGPT